MAEQGSDFGNIAANISQYVVRPLNAFGLGGFVFDNEGETTVNLTTEITDHFVEDGTTIQDHIAVKPKKVTLKNYVGELVHRMDESTDTPVQKVVQKLTTVSQYLPDVTAMAQQVLDLRDSENVDVLSRQFLGSFNVAKTINRVTDFWAFTKNMLSGQSRQQQAYMYFKALMEQKIIVSVQTPYEFMTRMAIESITAIQPEGSKYISDFTITLKQIRTASLLSPLQGKYGGEVTRNEDWETALQNRALPQNMPVTNQGSVQGFDDMTDEQFNSYFKNMYPNNRDRLDIGPPPINPYNPPQPVPIVN